MPLCPRRNMLIKSSRSMQMTSTVSRHVTVADRVAMLRKARSCVQGTCGVNVKHWIKMQPQYRMSRPSPCLKKQTMHRHCNSPKYFHTKELKMFEEIGLLHFKPARISNAYFIVPLILYNLKILFVTCSVKCPSNTLPKICTVMLKVP